VSCEVIAPPVPAGGVLPPLKGEGRQSPSNGNMDCKYYLLFKELRQWKASQIGGRQQILLHSMVNCSSIINLQYCSKVTPHSLAFFFQADRIT